METPGADDLFTIGTRAVIRKSGHTRPDHIDLFVQGLERVVIVKVEENGYLKARVRPLPLPDPPPTRNETLKEFVQWAPPIWSWPLTRASMTSFGMVGRCCASAAAGPTPGILSA